MSDKVQKIREEIEKQIDYAEDDTRYTESYREGLIAAYQTIKAFIDSLPEEPASEALEEEINYIGKNEYFDFSDWKSIARHFAEWQKQQMMKNFANGECVATSDNGWESIRVFRNKQLSVGDKVCVLIIKEGNQ